MEKKHKTPAYVLGILFFSILNLRPAVALSQMKTEKIAIGEKIFIHSDVLDENRIVLVRLPEDYEKSKKKYPVLYLLDAEFFFNQASAAVQFLSECGYIRNQPIPPMIVAGIVNVDRNRDYTPTHAPVQGNSRFPTSGKAKAFQTFLETELFPLMEKNYKAHPYRILCGWSLGGLFTVHTFLENPDLFSAYIAVSPSLWWDNGLMVKRADSLLRQGRIPGKPLVVTLGALEDPGMKGPVKDRFVSMMKERSNTGTLFNFIEIPGEGHNYSPFKAVYEGLIALYAEWMMPGEVPDKGFQAVKSFYKSLSVKYGYNVDIPESAYFSLANALFGKGKKKEALETAKRCTQEYPGSSYARYFLGVSYRQMEMFESAKKCFEKALEIEKAASEPNSEDIILYTILLQYVEEEINK